MKIAFIVGYFPSLSTTFILNQITGLLDMNCDLEIFALRNLKENKVHRDVERYQLMKRVNYFSIPLNKMHRFLKAIFLFIKNFHKDPVKVINSLNFIKHGHEALSLNLFYYVIPFLKKKFDIIHCHFGPNGFIAYYLKKIGFQGKIVTSFYGFDLSIYIKQKGENVYQRLFLCGDLFLPICNYFVQKLITYGCKPQKIMLHTIGIDVEKYKYIEKRLGPNEWVKILTVASLIEKKGYEYAIKAIKKVIHTHKNIKYYIVGNGPLRNKLESLVLQFDLGKYVEFVGPVNQMELIELYRNSHIFLLPSVISQDGDEEGTPTVLLEAQAMGLPIISSFHSGIPEIVLDGQSGFLVPEKDVDSLAERLNYLISHSENWLGMGKKGRVFVEKSFNIKKMNKQLMKIYESILKTNHV